MQSAECQTADWAGHKADCEIIARKIKIIPAERFDTALKRAWTNIAAEPALYAAVSDVLRTDTAAGNSLKL